MQDNSNNGSSDGNAVAGGNIADLVSKAVAEATAKQAEEFKRMLEDVDKKKQESVYQKEIQKANTIIETNNKVDQFTSELSFVKNELPNMLRKFKDVVGGTVIDSIININNSRINDSIKPEIIKNDTYSEFFNSIRKNEKYYGKLSSTIKNRIENGKLSEAFEDIVEYETNMLEVRDSSDTMAKSPLAHLWEISEKINK